LRLALGARRFIPTSVIVSDNIYTFFRDTLRFTDTEIDTLAATVFESEDENGRINDDRFSERTPFLETIVEADVMATDPLRFTHELWRDYLVGRHLSRETNRELWSDEGFDSAVAGSNAYECLFRTLEQLSSIEDRTDFVKAVYDWSYLAAASCVMAASEQERISGVPRLEGEVDVAVLAMVAEKRFDRIRGTQRRAEDVLRARDLQGQIDLLGATQRQQLVDGIQRIFPRADWFRSWQALFSAPDGMPCEDSWIELVDSEDSLIGWTAANTIRRSGTNSDQTHRLNELFGVQGQRRAVLWRIVHAIDHVASPDNVDFLCSALRTEHHWVHYGAVRALIEVASRADDDVRAQALECLESALREYQPRAGWMLQSVLTEVVSAVDIDGAPVGWADDVGSVLNAVMARAEPAYIDDLKSRIEALNLP
jgi:hypothetical protein